MPNNYSYFLAPNAEEDIESALDYIANNLCNRKAALDLYTEIEETFKTICEFPYASADCECFLISDKNIRHIPVKNYTLIYEIDKNRQRINILYFRYSRMDLSNTLAKPHND